MAWNIKALADLLPRLQQAQRTGMGSGTGGGSGAQPFQLPSLMQSAPLPSGPAANAFLDRFGPYRLQSFDAMRPAPQITGGGMGLFEPRGLEASGLLDPPPVAHVARSLLGGGGNGRGGNGNEPNTGRGRGGPGARGADRSGGASGGKASGPGGPKGGRSGPVSR